MKKIFMISLITTALSSCAMKSNTVELTPCATKSDTVEIPLSVISHTTVPFNPGVSYYVDKSEKIRQTDKSFYFMPLFRESIPSTDVNDIIEEAVQKAGGDCVGLTDAAVLYKGVSGFIIGMGKWYIEGYPIRRKSAQ